VLFLSACASLPRLPGEKMDRLELDMKKEKIKDILGPGFTVAEKREDNGTTIEVLSYRDFYRDDEFYMFSGRLENMVQGTDAQNREEKMTVLFGTGTVDIEAQKVCLPTPCSQNVQRKFGLPVKKCIFFSISRNLSIIVYT